MNKNQYEYATKEASRLYSEIQGLALSYGKMLENLDPFPEYNPNNLLFAGHYDKMMIQIYIINASLQQSRLRPSRVPKSTRTDLENKLRQFGRLKKYLDNYKKSLIEFNYEQVKVFSDTELIDLVKTDTKTEDDVISMYTTNLQLLFDILESEKSKSKKQINEIIDISQKVLAKLEPESREAKTLKRKIDLYKLNLLQLKPQLGDRFFKLLGGLGENLKKWIDNREEYKEKLQVFSNNKAQDGSFIKVTPDEYLIREQVPIEDSLGDDMYEVKEIIDLEVTNLDKLQPQKEHDIPKIQNFESAFSEPLNKDKHAENQQSQTAPLFGQSSIKEVSNSQGNSAPLPNGSTRKQAR